MRRFPSAWYWPRAEGTKCFSGNETRCAFSLVHVSNAWQAKVSSSSFVLIAYLMFTSNEQSIITNKLIKSKGKLLLLD